ncbi:hypothetical protein S40293_11342 [Stachybotrys chartarum IBT 40293]|nr:hypothetical protein S40293_11342 [Stachybotrys chartarum IBT 40293]
MCNSYTSGRPRVRDATAHIVLGQTCRTTPMHHAQWSASGLLRMAIATQAALGGSGHLSGVVHATGLSVRGPSSIDPDQEPDETSRFGANIRRLSSWPAGEDELLAQSSQGPTQGGGFESPALVRTAATWLITNPRVSNDYPVTNVQTKSCF